MSRIPLRARRPWLGGDLQTLRNLLCGPVTEPPPGGERLLLDLADGTGDRLAALLDRPPRVDPGRPLVILVHGLTGCEGSAYMRSMAASLLGLGFPVLRLNLRGAAPSAATSTGQYHAGRSEDFGKALAALAAVREPVDGGALLAAGTVAVGFSLGGNMLLKYLGEAGADTPIRRAAAVSPPIDLAATCRRIMRRRNRIYHCYLLRRMRDEACATLPDRWHAPARAARTTYQFDDAVVAPLHGFGTADRYYEICSAQGYLATIRVPTLVLHAANDPWIPVAAFSRFDWSSNPALTVEITSEGGHVGFHANDARAPWSDRRVGVFFRETCAAVRSDSASPRRFHAS